MPSPFPGMDPYLEAHWGDVHTSLMTYARDELQPCLPRDLRARVQERLVVAADDSHKVRSIYPDVRIVEKRQGRSDTQEKLAGGVAVAEPRIIRVASEPEPQHYLEIRERGGKGRVVTVLEILSPSNKVEGPAREQYRQKQAEVIEGGVNLVEIDLLRAGDWVLACDPETVDEDSPYRALVRRMTRPLYAEYYPMSLRERLPALAIPLRATDADVPLDLQALITQAYENGNYLDDIDYDAEPKPRLPAADARWADRLLQAAGRRKRSTRKKK